MKIFASLSILIGAASLCLIFYGIKSVSYNGLEGISIARGDGIVEQIVSILISAALIIGGYGVLKRTQWAYWCVLTVLVLTSIVFVIQGIYIALTFNSLFGRIWGLISQWIIAWLVFHFVICRYWIKKKSYFVEAWRRKKGRTTQGHR
jgi:hypothetical protein